MSEGLEGEKKKLHEKVETKKKNTNHNSIGNSPGEKNYGLTDSWSWDQGGKK